MEAAGHTHGGFHPGLRVCGGSQLLVLGGRLMKVFDVHVHYGWWGKIGERGSQDEWLDRLISTCEEAGVVKVALLGWPGEGNAAVSRAMEKYPGFVHGMAMVNLDADRPEVVVEYYQRGFAGLKLICPSRNYDDEAYFRFYELAEAHGMPILFHTGVIGGPVDYLLGDKEDADKAAPAPGEEARFLADLRRRARRSRYGVSSARMQPIYLDTIAYYFPELHIIGAHLGWPDYITACAVARWRPRVFFDVSGGDVVQRHIVEGRYLMREIRPEKLVYGSDCDLRRLKENIESWNQVFDNVGMTEVEKEKVFYGNACRIFGCEEGL